MKLLNIILARAGHRCAWCDSKLAPNARTVAERPCIDFLDGVATNREPSNMVASCFGCASTRQSEWPRGEPYTTPRAVAILGASIAGPSTFSVYLDSLTAQLAPGVAFEMALARVEAQRWQELEAA
jgi:hypothetical protein